MNRPLNILVEGWRDLPHSYSLVLCAQLLEMLQRPHLHLWFRDVEYFNPTWKALSPFSPEEQHRLRSIPPPPSDQRFDVVYRAAYPFDFTPSPDGAPVLVFATTEFRKLPDDCPCDFSRLRRDRVTITSPSNWSAAPFFQAGNVPVVLPHGVDPAKFRPLSAEEREGARRALGIAADQFVFAHFSTMTQNKGIVPLLGALNTLMPQFPQVRLLLKGLGNLYASRRNLEENIALLQLHANERERLLRHILFFDSCLDFASLNQIYNAADCYVSPYFGEGFNLPVIEALACGVPVLVTDGGATDDFVTEPRFHIPARSRLIAGRQATVLECSVSDVAAKMKSAMADPAGYRAAADALGERIRTTYGWAQIVDQLELILARVASSAR